MQRENTVTVLTAKSQSAREMGRKDFERSKQDVLEYVSQMIGTTQRQLEMNAGKAA